MSISGQPDAADDPGRWLAQAGEDLDAAAAIGSDPELPDRLACFLAHLAAEKALKALLLHSGKPLVRTHSLIALVDELPAESSAELSDGDLDALTPWSVAGRYPADLPTPTRRDAQASIAAAGRVLGVARIVLGR